MLLCKLLLASALLSVTIPAAAAELRLRPSQPNLQRALDEGLRDPSVTIVTFTPGTYRFREGLKVINKGRPVTLKGDGAVLDGGSRVNEAMRLRGANITVQGFTVQNFTRNGIAMEAVNSATIVRNRFRNIRSTGWTQGAIMGLQTVSDVRVVGNSISDTDYAGILFTASPTGKLANILIEGNVVRRICRIVRDCGAIYVGGRPRSTGVRILDNIVEDYGPPHVQTRGIYLDDGLSGARVVGNSVSGRGTYAVHIHGGSDNLITNNRFDVRDATHLLFEQTAPIWVKGRMRGNVMRDNEFVSAGDAQALIKRHGDARDLQVVNIDENRKVR